MQYLCREPKVIVYENVLTPDQCRSIMHAGVEFDSSTGFNYDSNQSAPTSHRTSSTYYDVGNRFHFVTEINFNLCREHFWFMDFSINHLECAQIQRYGVGQEYRPHYDYFNHPGFHTTENDRVGTVIVYLNDDFIGGETHFPELGVLVSPRQGAALFFDYKYIQELNRKTLHAGLPPASGEKWIITSWIRRLPFSNF